MARTISLPEDFYKIAYKEAQREHRSIPMQIIHWSKKAQALQLSIDNPWLDVYNAELLLESIESKNITEVKDVEAFLRELRSE